MSGLGVARERHARVEVGAGRGLGEWTFDAQLAVQRPASLDADGGEQGSEVEGAHVAPHVPRAAGGCHREASLQDRLAVARAQRERLDRDAAPGVAPLRVQRDRALLRGARGGDARAVQLEGRRRVSGAASDVAAGRERSRHIGRRRDGACVGGEGPERRERQSRLEPSVYVHRRGDAEVAHDPRAVGLDPQVAEPHAAALDGDVRGAVERDAGNLAAPARELRRRRGPQRDRSRRASCVDVEALRPVAERAVEDGPHGQVGLRRRARDRADVERGHAQEDVGLRLAVDRDRALGGDTGRVAGDLRRVHDEPLCVEVSVRGRDPGAQTLGRDARRRREPDRTAHVLAGYPDVGVGLDAPRDLRPRRKRRDEGTVDARPHREPSLVRRQALDDARRVDPGPVHGSGRALDLQAAVPDDEACLALQRPQLHGAAGRADDPVGDGQLDRPRPAALLHERVERTDGRVRCPVHALHLDAAVHDLGLGEVLERAPRAGRHAGGGLVPLRLPGVADHDHRPDEPEARSLPWAETQLALLDPQREAVHVESNLGRVEPTAEEVVVEGPEPQLTFDRAADGPLDEGLERAAPDRHVQQRQPGEDGQHDEEGEQQEPARDPAQPRSPRTAGVGARLLGVVVAAGGSAIRHARAAPAAWGRRPADRRSPGRARAARRVRGRSRAIHPGSGRPAVARKAPARERASAGGLPSRWRKRRESLAGS